MKTLYLIRHGHSLHNEYFTRMGPKAFVLPEMKDSPLTDKGREQSRKLAETIHSDIELVLVSPLTRTLETAHNIFKDKNIPIKCLECLREYPMGLHTCNIRSEASKLQKTFPEIDFSDISGKDVFWKTDGESLEELNVRIENMKEYIRNLPETKIAVVSHNSFIGQLKDKHISQLENNEQELQHCYPYKYKL